MTTIHFSFLKDWVVWREYRTMDEREEIQMDESNSAQELLQIFKSFRKAFIPPLPPPPAYSLLQEEELFSGKIWARCWPMFT